MGWKLQGVLVCGQLWIFYSKTNFEVLYLTSKGPLSPQIEGQNGF